MKISISRNVLAHLTSTVAATGAIYVTKLDEKGFLDGVKNTDFLDNIMFFKNIKEVQKKVFTVTKTADEVTLQINEEFLKDAITLTGKYYNIISDGLIQLVDDLKGFDKEVKDFDSKWSEKAEKEDLATYLKKGKVNGVSINLDKISLTQNSLVVEDVPLAIARYVFRNYPVERLIKKYKLSSVLLIKEVNSLLNEKVLVEKEGSHRISLTEEGCVRLVMKERSVIFHEGLVKLNASNDIEHCYMTNPDLPRDVVEDLYCVCQELACSK